MLFPREKLVLLAKSSLQEVSGLEKVTVDTEIAAGLFSQVIRRLSEKIGLRVVVSRGKPHRGWKVSTVAGYVYHNQTTFSLMEGPRSPEFVAGPRPEKR